LHANLIAFFEYLDPSQQTRIFEKRLSIFVSSWLSGKMHLMICQIIEIEKDENAKRHTKVHRQGYYPAFPSRVQDESCTVPLRNKHS